MYSFFPSTPYTPRRGLHLRGGGRGAVPGGPGGSGVREKLTGGAVRAVAACLGQFMSHAPGPVAQRPRALPVTAAGQAAAGSYCRTRTSPLWRHLLWAMAAAWGRCVSRAWLCRCDLTHPQTPKGGPSFGPSNSTLVPLCRTAWQGCGRNYRAALCAELKRPLVIEEVTPRPVQPHEVGDWPGPWTTPSPRPPPMTC